MRFLPPLLILAVALAFTTEIPQAGARPEFARREAKACGYCHINPRGGGSRNQMGLLYARNEFSFPVRGANLNSFTRAKDRAAMVRARKLIDIDHTRAAIAELVKLGKIVARDEQASKLVQDQLHALDVRGTEILGQARRMLRGQEAEEGIELIVMLTHEYKGLDVHAQAVQDLKELQREKERQAFIKKERREAKARLVYLDAMLQKTDGKPAKAVKLLQKVLKTYADTRVAKPAKEELALLEAAAGKEGAR